MQNDVETWILHDDLSVDLWSRTVTITERDRKLHFKTAPSFH